MKIRMWLAFLFLVLIPLINANPYSFNLYDDPSGNTTINQNITNINQTINNVTNITNITNNINQFDQSLNTTDSVQFDNLILTGNLTLGQKITFAFGEMIDNLVDGWIRITGNLNVTEDLSVNGGANITQDLTVGGNLTILDTIFLDSSLNHFIKIGSDTFNGIAEDAIVLSHVEESPSGEITFLLTSGNETTSWYQSGRNNSYSGDGNSKGIIPNYWGEENFSQGGIINMSQLSDYGVVCEFFDKDCVFTADTRGRGGSLLFTTGDLEVWRQTNLMEGITSRGDAEFILNGFDLDVVNGSVHIQTPRIQLVGFVLDDNVTILDANFNGDVLTPFSQTTSGGSAAEWTPISDVSCHDDLCDRALGGSGSPIRGMSSSFSSIFLDNLNLTFFITSSMGGSDNFTITTNNNAGSGEVLVFTTSTDLVDAAQSVLLPSSMDNRSSVTLTFNFSANNQNSDLIFIDDILVIANATATTTANITVQDSDIKFGDGTGDGITYQGNEAIGFSIMNITADLINFIGNSTFINVIESFLNVTGNLEVQGNADFGGNITASNITADFFFGDGSQLTGLDGLFNSTSWNRSGTNVFLANSGDNVGIGTASPNVIFHIKKDSAESPVMKLERTGSGDVIGTWETGSNTIKFGTTTNDQLIFKTNNADRITIQADGDVGIGTTSPSSLLTVGNVIDTNEVDLSGLVYVNSTSGRVGIGTSTPSTMLHLDGASGEDSFTLSNAVLRIEQSVGGGINTVLNDGDGNSYINNLGGGLCIGCDSTTKPIRIESGATTVLYADVNQFRIDAFAPGNINACRSGTIADGTIALGICTSSERYKKNLREYTNPALAFLMKLKPKMYESKIDNRTELGLIAEEVYEVTKQFDTANFNLTKSLIVWDLNETTNGTYIQSVDYRQGLTTISIKAIQELVVEGQALQQEVNLIKSETCARDPTWSWC